MEMSRVLCPDCSSSVSSSRASSPSISWTPRPSNSVKIDCDASWKASYQMGFAGIVVCSHTSMLLDGRRVNISAPSEELNTSMLLVHLNEVRSAAKSLQLSDIQTSASHCVFELVTAWECGVIIQDIRSLASELRHSISFYPIPAAIEASSLRSVSDLPAAEKHSVLHYIKIKEVFNARFKNISLSGTGTKYSVNLDSILKVSWVSREANDTAHWWPLLTLVGCFSLPAALTAILSKDCPDVP